MDNEKKSLKERYVSWSYEHIPAKRAIEYTVLFLVCTLSAALFSFGFRAFLQPINLVEGNPASLVSGGVSGIAQNITIILELIFPGLPSSWIANYLYSILYFGLNIPIFILSWFGVGKRYTIFTLINVIEVSVFTSLFQNIEFIYKLFEVINANGGFLSRALFAGICTGLAGAMTFKFDFSDGGIDSVAYYMALKKSTSVGKYSVILNLITVSTFAVLSVVQNHGTGIGIAVVGSAFFSAMYMIVSSFVVDMINLRNKKVEIKIVTNMPELSKVLLLQIPHGQTLSKGIGAYSGKERTIITLVVSAYEVNSVVRIVRKEDPAAFIQATALQQVYGRFYIPPVK